MKPDKLLLGRSMFILIIILISTMSLAKAIPGGATFTYNNTENVSPAAAASITTVGGSFTTLVLNATAQTPRWKAYVGNVTGSLTLDNANNYTIYNWIVTLITGEIYASRNSSINWSAIRCANSTIIENEQTALNISASKADSINNTFNNTIHKSFYIGTTRISNSSCPAIATYINDTRQSPSENATFQEVLLTDNARMVYSAILEQDRQGFNQGSYDFQMIVAEDEYTTTPTPYYFWLEII